MSSEQEIRFENLGRLYHLRIRAAEDLRFATDMEEALWVATSAPISTLIGDATKACFHYPPAVERAVFGQLARGHKVKLTHNS